MSLSRTSAHNNGNYFSANCGCISPYVQEIRIFEATSANAADRLRRYAFRRFRLALSFASAATCRATASAERAARSEPAGLWDGLAEAVPWPAAAAPCSSMEKPSDAATVLGVASSSGGVPVLSLVERAGVNVHSGSSLFRCAALASSSLLLRTEAYSCNRSKTLTLAPSRPSRPSGPSGFVFDVVVSWVGAAAEALLSAG